MLVRYVRLRRPLARAYSNATSARPLRLAVIGSGPSGFYAASKILQTLPESSSLGRNVEIHMYDRLPTPYGLVRYGVAPDHPEVKNCQHKFDELAQDPRFQFFGNVSIGNTSSPVPGSPDYNYPDALHVPLSALFPFYNSILFTYGSSHSNGLPSTSGSTSSPDRLANVLPALAFVNWYNGHPAYADLAPDLSQETVTVIGHGNVAVDCARILLKNPNEFVATDMPTPVIEALRQSRVRRVELIGRRGPAQVAFTTKEFREMLNLDGVRFVPVEEHLMNEAKEVVKGDRAKARLMDLMAKGSKKVFVGAEREFEVGFLKSPKAFLSGVDDRVNSVVWAKNTLLAPVQEPPAPQPTPTGSPFPSGMPLSNMVAARPTGEEVKTKTGMVIESVGYRAEDIQASIVDQWAFPFDRSRGTAINLGGRITDVEGVPGMYTAGWLARGPVGVIASTMQHAYSVAAAILADHYESTLPPTNSILPLDPQRGTPAFIQASGVKVVTLEDWKRIDEAETIRGKKGGKPREKFLTVGEMLSVIT